MALTNEEKVDLESRVEKLFELFEKITHKLPKKPTFGYIERLILKAVLSKSFKNFADINSEMEEIDKGGKSDLIDPFSNKQASNVWEFLSVLVGRKILMKTIQDSENQTSQKERKINQLVNEIEKKNGTNAPKILTNRLWYDYIKRRCGQLNILGINPQPVEDFYIEPMMSSLDSVIDSCDFNFNDLIQELEKDGSKIQIFGKAGIGKTSLLKYLAISCLNWKIKRGYIPFYISLKRLQSKFPKQRAMDLLSIYRESIEPESKVSLDEVQIAIEKGKVMFLIDGLDLNENTNFKQVQILEEFIERYPKNTFVISSKNEHIIAEDYLKDFEEYELQSFDKERITKFATNWFKAERQEPKHQSDTSMGKQNDLFLEDLKTKDYLAELAKKSTPLLLSCICLTYPESSQAASFYFTGNGLLLQQCAMSRLLQWEDTDGERSPGKSDVYRFLSIEQRSNLISYLAIKLMEKEAAGSYVPKKDIKNLIVEYAAISNIQASLTERKLLNVIDDDPVWANEMLDAIESQDGIIIERINNEYSFIHEQIRDYFCALHLSKADFPEWERCIVKYNSNGAWASVILNALRLRQIATQKILKKIASYEFKSAPELNISITKRESEIEINIFKKHLKKEPSLETWIVKSQDRSPVVTTFFELEDNTPKIITKSLALAPLSPSDVDNWLSGVNIEEIIPTLRKIF